MKDFIESDKAVMGIEFGSTRIKAVLVDDGFKVIAQGAHDWENKLVDGVWSYSLEDVEAGVRDAYAKAWRGQQEALEEMYNKTGMNHVSMRTDEDYVKKLMQLFK